jgi:FMN reductase
MTTRKIAVVSAGVSQPSSTGLLADRLAAATESALHDQEIEVEVKAIELRELAVDIAKTVVTNVPSRALREAIQTVTRADGLIVVTPVFTASYSGLFKSFFDAIDNTALIGMPVLLGATGGTERHSLVLDYHLRPMFAYLRSIPTPTAVYAASADWGAGGERNGQLQRRIDRAAGELARLATGRPTARDNADSELTSVPFEQLLGARNHRPVAGSVPADS